MIRHRLSTVHFDNPDGHIESATMTCFCGEIIKDPILDGVPQLHAVTNHMDSVTCEACKEEYAMQVLSELDNPPDGPTLLHMPDLEEWNS